MALACSPDAVKDLVANFIERHYFGSEVMHIKKREHEKIDTYTVKFYMQGFGFLERKVYHEKFSNYVGEKSHEWF